VSATVFWQDANELATISVTFTGTPTAVILTVTDPTGAVTTPSMTGTGAGPYTANVACAAAPGIWSFLVDGTGTASDAIAGTWTVSSPALTQLYATPAELKSRLAIPDTGDDFEVTLAVQAASRAVDGYCERYFYRAAATRTYVPADIYRCRTDDLVSVTTLATDPAGTTAQGGNFPVTWPAAAFQLLPYNPGKIGEPWPYTSIRAVGGLTFPWVTPLLLMRADRVQVTGVFGWPQVPLAVKQAALIAAADLFRLKDAPFGVAGFGEFGAVHIQSNPRVTQLLAPYRRHAFLAA
jgi:hypothetical protein